MTGRKFIHHAGLISLLWLCFALPQFRYLNDFPRGVHVWAQSDRFSLALNYLEHPKFTEPRTHALYTENGRVGVEFPLIPFLSASWAKLTNTPHLLPFWFRLLQSLSLIICIYFSALLVGKSTMAAAGSSFLIMASPILSFYGYNFLPDIAGFSLAILALGYYSKGISTQRESYLVLAMVMSAMATLFKLSAGIYFASIVAHQLYLLIRSSPKHFLQKMPFFLLATLLFIIILLYDYFLFIKVNRELWSGVFMSSGQPVLSIMELWEVLKAMMYWGAEYLNVWQFVCFVLAMIFSKPFLQKNSAMRSFFVLVLLGILAFIFGLGQQLKYHDYYVLASFFPLVMFIFIHVVSSWSQRLPREKKPALLFVCVLVWAVSIPHIHARHHHIFDYGRVHIDSDVRWLINGRKCVDQMKSKNNATIFVLYEQAPNTSLIYLNHRGLVFNHEQMGRKEAHLEYWVERLQPDYFILQSKYESDLKRDKPYLMDKIVHRCDNIILIAN